MISTNKIVIRESPYDASGEPPYGFYHILKCYDEVRGDMVIVATVGIQDGGLELATIVARALAWKWGWSLEVAGTEKS